MVHSNRYIFTILRRPQLIWTKINMNLKDFGRVFKTIRVNAIYNFIKLMHVLTHKTKDIVGDDLIHVFDGQIFAEHIHIGKILSAG